MTRQQNRRSSIQRNAMRQTPTVGQLRAGRPRIATFEPLEVRALLSVSPATVGSWHNGADPHDVNNDGQVTPLDALIVLNDLNTSGPHADGAGNASVQAAAIQTTSHAYLDVNGDGLVSPIDALQIINALNSPPLAQVRLQAADTNGNPISSIPFGQPFELEAFVQDLRSPSSIPPGSQPGGVFSAYVDTTYDPVRATISPVASITYAPNYLNSHAGDLTTPGFAQHVGASTTVQGGLTEHLLWSIPITATAAGNETFTPSPPADQGLYGLDEFGLSTPVDPNQINLIPASIQITVPTSLLPTASINNISQSEGTSGTTTPFVFTVTLSAPSAQNVVVNYATADGTAHAPADYSAQSGALTFAAGSTTATITVPVIGNTTFQPTETFSVKLQSAANANVSPSSGTGTGSITNNNPAPVLSIANQTVNRPTSGNTNTVFMVTLSGATKVATTVAYATTDGTAHAPTDYTAESGTLTFAVGATTANITVPIIGNSIVQPSQTFFVTLSGPANATLNASASTATGTITNNSPAPTLSISNPSVVRPTSGTVNEVFSVTLTGGTTQTATVQYFTTDGTAHTPADYTSQSGTLTFSPGTTLANITVPVIGSASAAGSETYTVNLANATNAQPASLQGIGTIFSAANSGLSVSDIIVAQPTSGTTNAVFTVALPGASNKAVTVQYATADGTAHSPGDYAATTGTLTFAPGVTSQAVTVVVQGNGTPGTDEEFFLNLTNATNAQISRSAAAATLHNTAGTTQDLAEIRLEVDDLNGNPLTTPLVKGQSFQVEAFVTDLRPTMTQGVFAAYLNVSYQSALATPLGTITFGPAYQTFTSGDVISQPGQFNEIGAVATSQDPNSFPPLGANEQLLFTVPMTANGSGALQFSGLPSTQFPQHDVLLFGTNPPVPVTQVAYEPSQVVNIGVNTFTINDVTQTDATSGTTNFVFTVTRIVPANSIATVVYSTADGSAHAPADYSAERDTLTFAPGTTTQTITVPVVGTTTDQPDKTFLVSLSSPVNAAISGVQGIGTIHYDNSAPTVTVANASAGEGQPVVFIASLSQASGFPITVNYTTISGTALPGINFTAQSGTLTFDAGSTTQTVSVPTIATLTQAGSLQFKLQLSGPVNATLAASTATGTITFVQPATVSGFVYVDGNSNGQKDSGETGIANVEVTINSTDGTVSKSTVTGTDGSYSFVGLKPGTYNVVEIQPGFYVNGTPSSNQYTNVALQAGQIDGNLNFGELGLRVQFVSAFFNRRAFLASTAVTGNIGIPVGTQNVNLTQGDVWVSFDNGWQGARKFEALFNSNLGTATMTLYDNSFNVLATSVPEPGGAVLTLVGTLGTPYFLKITGSNTNTSLTITESLTGADASAIVSNSGNTNLVFNVSLSAPATIPVTVVYATADGTAQAGVNYFAEIGTLTFAVGVVSQSVTVPVLANTMYGPNETFLLNLSSPTNAFVYRQGTGTIINQNSPPNMSIIDTNLFDPTTGTGTAVFTVSLSQTSALPATVAYTTATGTLPANDIIAQSGTLTFAPGTKTLVITVPVRADSSLQSSETFFVKLSNAVGAILIKNQATGTVMLSQSASASFVTAPAPSISPAVSTASYAARPSAATSAGTATVNGAVGPSGLSAGLTTRSLQTQATDQAMASSDIWSS